jgi:hypothetical protein
MVASINLIQSPINFILQEILMRYYHSQILELCHSIKSSVRYLYVMTLPCSLVTDNNIYLVSLNLLLDQPPY